MEMTDLMESLESQHQASHPFHRSLEISPKTRDFHIPTAPATGCFYWNETELKKKQTEAVYTKIFTPPESEFSEISRRMLERSQSADLGDV
jgi:hypothetical protein